MLADGAVFEDHDGPRQIAAGGTNVFINGVPAGGWAGAGVFGLQLAWLDGASRPATIE